MKHKKYQKHFRKSRVLFWRESQKNEIEYAKSKPKKFKKKTEAIKNTGTEKEGKMEQDKTCVLKNKENKLKTKFKKSKAKTNQRRETGREKVKEEKRLEEEKKGGCSKKKRKNVLFLKKKDIICPKREDTFFQRKVFSAKKKTEKTFLGFFQRKRYQKLMFQYVSFFLFWCERKSKKKLKKEHKQIVKNENGLKKSKR